MGPNVPGWLRLLLIADDGLVPGPALLAACRRAVAGGVSAVQLRCKRATPRDFVALAREAVRGLPVPVLINDRLDVALAAGAAGVHLGADDLPVALARRAVPSGFLIGASVGGTAELPGGRGADYWGVGPLRVTTTKPDAGAPLGVDGFAALVRAAEGIPCLAIGGVGPDDVALVRAVGGAGVAVGAGILAAADPAEAARRYLA
jgi:thiamine-phosphate pyrophosphorylase